jgi:hypothetical protein
MANNILSTARRIKNDEFYTQYTDIQKEVEAYLEFNPDVFRGKVVYCNCDDPFESNFFRYFVLNFNRLGLKQLITTSYKPSPIANTQLGLFGNDITIADPKGRPKITANKFIINEVHDMDGDGALNLTDVAEQLKANKNNEWSPLNGDGDFRSEECIELLKQSDIVVTNPPFSLFREYITQLFKYRKKFLIIGNINAITYIEVFPLIKGNLLWLGPSITSGDREFEVPKSVVDMARFTGTVRDGRYYQKVVGVRWFTNLDHGRRHQSIPLMTEADVIKFATNKPFDKYDNFDAIEVSQVKNIPSDYSGAMGVPISFLDKYSPEQFQIIGSYNNGIHGGDLGARKTTIIVNGKESMWNGPVINKVPLYKRIIIKHRKAVS